MTPQEALRQCVEAMKEVDFADCGKDDARWHKLVLAQQVAEEVLKRPEQEPYSYAYECVQPGTDGKGWAQFINRDPVMPKNGVRNIIPLYAAPQPAAAPSGDVVEHVARVICEGCEENPDHKGDARGNEYRWQDYVDVAVAAITATKE